MAIYCFGKTAALRPVAFPFVVNRPNSSAGLHSIRSLGDKSVISRSLVPGIPLGGISRFYRGYKPARPRLLIPCLHVDS